MYTQIIIYKYFINNDISSFCYSYFPLTVSLDQLTRWLVMTRMAVQHQLLSLAFLRLSMRCANFSKVPRMSATTRWPLRSTSSASIDFSAETRWLPGETRCYHRHCYSTSWFGPFKKYESVSVKLGVKIQNVWNFLPPRMWSRNDSNGVYFELTFN